MKVPVRTKLTDKSEKCPLCSKESYFDQVNLWPSNPGERQASYIDNDNSKNALRDQLAKQFFTRTLKCLGCNGFIVDVFPEGIDKEPVQLWPMVSRTFPAKDYQEFIPKSIIRDFNEAALIENLSPTASATLSRRCLQTIKDKYIEVIGNTSFLKEQVRLVLQTNTLPSYISDELHSIRSIGNNAAHPNIDPSNNEIIEIENGEASACLDVLEDIIDHLYVKPLNSQKRKEIREKKHGLDTK